MRFVSRQFSAVKKDGVVPPGVERPATEKTKPAERAEEVSNVNDENSYPSEEIKAFNPREHVRLRPGMYLGGIDQQAIHELIYQVLHDAIEEHRAGYCDHIWIVLRNHDEISIRDNGRGIPIHEINDRRFLEIVMTQAGILRVDGDYHITTGFHGIGLNWVNALTSKCVVEVARDGYLWRQTYHEGIPQTEVEKVRELRHGQDTGKTITFTPDLTIFEPNPISYEWLSERARELAYLLPSLRISLRDEREGKTSEEEFYFQGGLLDYLGYLNKSYSVVHEPIICSNEWVIRPKDKREYTVAVEIAVQYVHSMDTTIIGYLDLVRTADGFHTDMLPKGILPTVNQRRWIERRWHRDETAFSLAEILPGLTAIVRVNHSQPQYQTARNLYLLNFDVRGIVADTIYNSLQYEYQETLSQIVEKCLINRRALKRKRKANSSSGRV